MLKIYGRANSINVRKVLWTCAEIGVHYEREDWGSGFASTRTAEFLALNPNGLVPVIVDEETHKWLLVNPEAELTVDLVARELRTITTG